MGALDFDVTQRSSRRCKARLLALLLLALGSSSVRAQNEDPTKSRGSLALGEQELDVIDLLLELRQRYPPADHNLSNVRVVDVDSGTVSEPTCVEVRQSRISSLFGSCSNDPPVNTIDGKGQWLIPGLADMHVHQLETAAGHLLNVAHGVTTVREMVGFPFLLEWRRQASEGTLFAPSMIVASHIISEMPMGIYATLVSSEQKARAAVRAQVTAGYDAIKIHNVLSEPLYSAISAEARRLNVDFLGHVPHQLTVRSALAAGQWTLEHLKGYIDDRTLQIRDDGSVEATRGSMAWITPTLYAHRQYLRGVAAQAWFEKPEARYVPALRREQWRATVEAPLQDIHRDLLDKQRAVLTRLAEVTVRFLAGTDSGGGYPFMVPGIALQEELLLLSETGLTPILALRAATTNAAAAARQVGRFGTVTPGSRADLVLLAADPTRGVGAVRQIEGVMLRGAWLDRATLDKMLLQLEQIQARVPPIADAETAMDPEWFRQLVDRVHSQRAAGYVHPPFFLEALAEGLSSGGFPEAAETLHQRQRRGGP